MANRIGQCMDSKNLNVQYKQKHGAIISEYVKFAFSGDQLTEMIKEFGASEHNQIIHIGAGGYVLKSKLKEFTDKLAELKKWLSEEKKILKTKVTKKVISEEKYYEMLEVLPPIMHSNNVFQVDEPYDHDYDGNARYGTYQKIGKRHYYIGLLTYAQAKAYAKGVSDDK